MKKIKSFIRTWASLMVGLVSVICSVLGLVCGTTDVYLCVGLLLIGVICVIFNWVSDVEKENRIMTLEGKTTGLQTDLIDNEEFLYVISDSNGQFLFGIRRDASVEWAKGIPFPILKELKRLEKKINEIK